MTISLLLQNLSFIWILIALLHLVLSSAASPLPSPLIHFSTYAMSVNPSPFEDPSILITAEMAGNNQRTQRTAV